MIAIQILAAWFLLSGFTTAAYLAIRTHQKHKAITQEYNLRRAEYQLEAARYLKCIARMQRGGR